MKQFIFLALLFVACRPVAEFKSIPVYKNNTDTGISFRSYKPGAPNIFILADNKGTEIFDLVAPFYLFSMTGKANVYIIAKTYQPISVTKGFFAYPHYTYAAIDSLGLEADAIIIPNFSATRDDQQDPYILDWIRRHHKPSVKLLSICAGSFTAAATGLFDGKTMTTHASEMAGNKRLFAKPNWVQQVSYTRDGNLYSSAGVSNATEGSLALIRDMFGDTVMQAVMKQVDYRFDSLKTSHHSEVVSPADKSAFVKKVLFRNDPDIGVLLQEGVDEFKLAAILDSYHRSFPASIKTYSVANAAVTSRFGLVILPSGDASGIVQTNEMHVLDLSRLTPAEKEVITKVELIGYDKTEGRYIFDVCLERIAALYGNRFQASVKKLLDYN